MTAQLPLLAATDVASGPSQGEGDGLGVAPRAPAVERGDAAPATQLGVRAGAAPLVITAYGKPITQGSKTRNRYGGVRDDNAATLKPWREAVKTAALDVMLDEERLTGPVSVTLLFYFDRPMAHYRTGRNAHVLRENAPAFPANRKSGDIDKIERSCFDALTDAGVWVDDSQVAHATAWKLWVGEQADALRIPGVRIEVRPLALTS